MPKGEEEKKNRGAPLHYSVPPTVTHKHKGTHFFWVPTDIWGFLSGAPLSPARAAVSRASSDDRKSLKPLM